MKLTFDEYDKLMEIFDKMKGHSCWPTPEQVEMFCRDPRKWLVFCLYLYEKNPAPVSAEEKESKHAMMKFLNQYMELVDPDECTDRDEADNIFAVASG